MNRLHKGMYEEASAAKDRLFGLSCDQDRDEALVEDAGWYNADGERLGWGSLTALDLRRIAAELADGEVFIVLSVFDSYWGLGYGQGQLPNGCQPYGQNMASPGRDYVASKCEFVVTRHHVYRVDHEAWAVSEHQPLAAAFVGGLICETLTGAQARQLIVDPARARGSAVPFAHADDVWCLDEMGEESDVLLLEETVEAI